MIFVTATTSSPDGEYIDTRSVPFRHSIKTGAVQLRDRDGDWQTVGRTLHASQDPQQLAVTWLESHSLEAFAATGSHQVAREVLDWAYEQELARSSDYEENPRGDCRRAARGPQDFVFPATRRYPIPTKKCARTALSMASWPNNLSQAERVALEVLDRYGTDQKLRDQAHRLLDRVTLPLAANRRR